MVQLQSQIKFESQIPCICSHAWPVKMILTKLVAVAVDNVSIMDTEKHYKF